MKTKIWKFFKVLIPLLLGIYLTWYFYSSMSEENKNYFFKVFESCNYYWIILALFLSVLAYFIRAWRWSLVLEPLNYKTTFWNRYHAMMIGYLVNLTIPRAGEASRALMLYRSDNVPFTVSFGTIIQERIIDLFMLANITFLSIIISKDTFFELFKQLKERFPKNENSSNLFYIYIGISISIFLIFIFIINKKYPTLKFKIKDLMKELLKGILSIRNCKSLYKYIVSTLTIWILYIVYFAIAFLSLNETNSIPLEGILLAFILGAVGISFTNGGIGVFPLLVGMVVGHFLKETEENAIAIGNALGMLIWVSQTLLLIVMGLISLILLPKKYK